MAAVKNSSSYRVSAVPAIVMAQLLGAAAVTLMFVWLYNFRGGLAIKSDDKQQLFNIHALVMLLFLYVGGQAIMAFKTVPGPRKTQKFIHLFLHLLSLALGSLGFYAVFTFHNDLKIPNMYTLHSWIGMGTFCLYGLQWIIGFLTFWFPGAKNTTRANAVPWHAFVGLIIFIMAIVAAETGLAERFIFSQLRHGSQALIVNFTGISILLFGIAVILSVIL